MPNRKWVLTAEQRDELVRTYRRVGSTRIARRWGWPQSTVARLAASLGLSRSIDRREWSPEDLAELERLAGTVEVRTLSRKLDRSVASVWRKINRLGFSARVRDGYTMSELVQCFGVSEHTIYRWLREKKLVARGRRLEVPCRTNPYQFEEDDVRRFIRLHGREEVSLDKVEAEWFWDMMR